MTSEIIHLLMRTDISESVYLGPRRSSAAVFVNPGVVYPWQGPTSLVPVHRRGCGPPHVVSSGSRVVDAWPGAERYCEATEYRLAFVSPFVHLLLFFLMCCFPVLSQPFLLMLSSRIQWCLVWGWALLWVDFFSINFLYCLHHSLFNYCTNSFVEAWRGCELYCEATEWSSYCCFTLFHFLLFFYSFPLLSQSFSLCLLC